LAHLQDQAGKEAAEAGGRLNFRVLFHMILQDQSLPDLIWNQETRLELRMGLEAEIQGFQRQQQLHGASQVSWNHMDFRVEYPSLKTQRAVGGMSIHLLLDASESFLLASIEDPRRFAELLFRRILCDWQGDRSFALQCVRALARLYTLRSEAIGPLEDCMVVISFLKRCSDAASQHRLLELISIAVQYHPGNAMLLIEKEVIELMVDLAACAHANPLQVGNALSRDATKTRAERALLIKSGEEDETLFARDDALCPRVWYTAPPAPCPPRPGSERGPFLLGELKNAYATGEIGERTLVASGEVQGDYEVSERVIVVDTGRWRPLIEVEWLRLTVLTTGQPVFTPAEAALLAIGILKQLVNVVPSMGPEGVPLWPVPRAKRLISSDGVLPRLATLLLANDLQVVNAVAELLLDLCHLHHAAAEQLFRTGAFYFACSFTGSNFQTLARLFAATHLRQAHGLSGAAVAAAGELPLHERSVLGSILPTALIMVLENYGCDKVCRSSISDCLRLLTFSTDFIPLLYQFAEVMIGEFDTPEVIWSSTMRKHMVDMLGQHLGDFPYRLRQNPATPYEWCPLPPIQYAHLRNEVYCHNYYIRNICDEMRYPGWPIAEPAEVLRSALEEWRREMRKDDTHAVQGSDARAAGNGIGKGMTVASALECLGITVGVSDKDMRKAYRNLARKYHPDRNPAGRDMFERVHGAYELLSTVDGDFSAAATHPSPNNLRWLMRIQIMLFKSYSPHIKEYKYPGYPLLLDLLRKARSVLAAAPDPQASSISWMEPASAACAIVASCCELTCETCAINALNGEELTREGGLADMLKCLRDVVSSLLDKNALQPYELTVLESTVRVVSSVAQYEAARSALLPHARTLAEDISVILPLEAVRIANEVGDGLPEEKDTVVVMTVQYALQAVCRLCKHQSLQQALADAGTVWYLIPMILSYDPSLEGQGGDHEGQRGKVTQHALNSKAAMAAWCLGCLGGYMADDLACPKNEVVRSALSALLTPQLAQRLRFRRGNELLTTLNSNTEKATCIWLPDMRLQLLSYVNEARKGRGPGRVTAPQELIDAATGISFDALTEEQQVGGVFLRIFNANPDASVSEIESIDGFCRSLLEYLNLAELETDSSTEFKAAVEAFSHLLLHPGKGPLCVDAVCEKGLGSIFGLISREPGSPVFCLAAKILSNMASQRPFAEAVVSQGHLEHLLEIVAGEDLDRACEPARWEIVESLCATVQVAQAILQGGGLLVLLGIISGFEGFTTSLDSRMGAARVLHSLVWHQVLSSQSNTVLGWFFPVTLIELIKADPPAAINTFDSDHETPELIWTQDMREELRTVVSRHLHVYLALPKEEKSSYHLPSHIRVRYAALEQEICIGGVYLRLFLRHPAHDLRQPVQFLQKVMDAWLHECEAQLPSAQSATAVQAGSVQTGTGETALVLGREDLLSLYTSALVFVLKRRAGLADQLVAWGFIVKVADLLERAVGACARGVPMTSCCRILHELASRESTAASIIASSRSFILLLQRALASPLPRDTAFVLGLMKKVIAVRSAPGWEPMVLMGIDHGFIPFIIGNVLESSELGNVHDASAAKVNLPGRFPAMGSGT
jgi:DnaJ family protein C protein 13